MNQDTNQLAPAFSTTWWKQNGYEGFTSLTRLASTRPPTDAGIYAVLRVSTAAHEFLMNNPGGHHKGKDPTAHPGELTKNWVKDTDTLYIGTSAKLNKRLRQLRQFGGGQPVGHWGGRYIWQLADTQDLTVCWKEVDKGRKDAKAQLLAEFKGLFGERPFANLQDS